MDGHGLEVEGRSNAIDVLRSASALSTNYVDLTRRGLTELPRDFPCCPKLEVSTEVKNKKIKTRTHTWYPHWQYFMFLHSIQSFYLEGNALVLLPESLFLQCSFLRWLDLRNNALENLPSAVCHLKSVWPALVAVYGITCEILWTVLHVWQRSLRTLLLEGNKIVSLPVDLCKLRMNSFLKHNARTHTYTPSLSRSLLLSKVKVRFPHNSFSGKLAKLNGLSLAGNPLQFPPQQVIQQGTKVCNSCMHIYQPSV